MSSSIEVLKILSRLLLECFLRKSFRKWIQAVGVCTLPKVKTWST